jgi:putative ABC transport system permease protein
MTFLTFITRNLLRRPTRTALTLLGLSVAVGSVIALLGIAHNFTATMANTFERRGIDLIVLAAGKTDQLSSDISESIPEQVARIPGVLGVSSTLLDLIEIPRGRSSISVIAQGWNWNNFAFDDLEILAGRRLLAGDDHQAILGVNLADSLGKTVGDTIELQGEPFAVVGVYRSLDVFENGAVVIPLRQMQRLAGRPGRITAFGVRVDKSGTDDPGPRVEAIRQQIEAFRGSEGIKLTAQPRQNYLQSASHLKVTKAMAWMVSAVAILIGVISMLNTMVMSVLERTQEIGILRAVGWPPSRIVRMILGEAILLGVAAAVLGTIAATALTYVLSMSPKVRGFIEPGIAPMIIAQGVAITVLIGLLGGAYPAYRAARLLPTEAIRHD